MEQVGLDGLGQEGLDGLGQEGLDGLGQVGLDGLGQVGLGLFSRLTCPSIFFLSINIQRKNNCDWNKTTRLTC
jgi:hypothetical protein